MRTQSTTWTRGARRPRRKRTVNESTGSLGGYAPRTLGPAHRDGRSVRRRSPRRARDIGSARAPTGSDRGPRNHRTTVICRVLSADEPLMHARRIKRYYVDLSRAMIGNRLFRANIRNNNKNYHVFYCDGDHRRRAENCVFVLYILRIYCYFISPAPITRAILYVCIVLHFYIKHYLL